MSDEADFVAWLEELRATRLFVCYASPAWQTDAQCQQRLDAAREAGKTIVFFVPPGVSPPRLLPGEIACHARGPKDMATQVIAILDALEQEPSP